MKKAATDSFGGEKSHGRILMSTIYIFFLKRKCSGKHHPSLQY